jgi:hypothetical protein
MAHLLHGQLWTEQEDTCLLEAVSKTSPLNWNNIADLVEQKPENCPHGCGVRFSRLPDLKRHIKEQHQCAFRCCQDKIFQSRIELDMHAQSHGDEILGFQCGNCELKGLQTRFIRPNKLKGHFKSRHKTSGDFSFKEFQCLKTPCLSDSGGGIFFSSISKLELHIQFKHTTKIGGTSLADDEDYGQ